MTENQRKRKSTKNVCEMSLRQKKLRNENEKRRRDIFNELITNLGEILFDEINKKSSKNHLLKETVLFLKQQQNHLIHHQHISNEIKQIFHLHWKPLDFLLTNQQWFYITIQSMNCFLMILNDKFNIEYLSNNISCYFLMKENQSIYELIHSSDHQILKDYFSNEHQFLKNISIRWKRCYWNEYEQCQINGAFRKMKDNSMKFVSIVQLNTFDRCLIDENEICSKDEFLIHLNPNGKIISINSKTEEYLGYQSFELIGKTLFDLVHPDDLQILINAHQSWKKNVDELSECYRILTKGEEWISIRTSTKVQINSWTGKPLFYICSNSFSQWENKDRSQWKQLNVNEEDESNEIKKFLIDVDNERNRCKIHSRLIELRRCKEDEIRHRQDEIQILNDMITFLNQYQFKQIESNQDLFSSLFDSPLTTTTTNVLSSPLFSFENEQLNKDI